MLASRCMRSVELMGDIESGSECGRDRCMRSRGPGQRLITP